VLSSVFVEVAAPAIVVEPMVAASLLVNVTESAIL
jgi:hypothetical protein